MLRDKKVSLGTVVVLCGMAASTGAGACYAWQHWNNGVAQQKLREIDALVTSRYVGEIDKNQVADYAAVGYITGLGDRWASYISAQAYEEYAMQNGGQTCGIGVSIVTSTDSIHISDVYDDSPAQQAGIQKGDWLIGAEGLTIETDGVQAVIDAIQGEEGTAVEVTVRKESTGEEQLLSMTRAIIQQKMAWGEMLDHQVGYIRINNFHDGSAAQFQTALERLLADGAEALIIDVRHNGGGRVKEMSEALDLLLPEGTIMTLRTKNGQETVYTSDAEQIDQPIAVLADDRSISAAEFFAAALQEYKRATVVGTHTTGKGRAQQTFQLSDGSAISISIEQYYTPKGNNLADIGIAPDIEVSLTEQQQENFFFLPQEQDYQLQKALEILISGQNP